MKNSRRKRLFKTVKIVAIALLLLTILKGVGILVLLIALSIGLSFFINNFPIRQIGIELVTFIAVLTGLEYGAVTALVITFILISYHLIASNYIGIYVLWVIPAYCAVAAASGLLQRADVIALGILSTLAINLIEIFFTLITEPANLSKHLPYGITNVIFNILLFTLIGRPALALIAR